MSQSNHYYQTDWMCFLYEYLGNIVDAETNPASKDRLKRIRRKFQPVGRYVELTHIATVQLIAILETALRDIDKNPSLKNDAAKTKAKELIGAIIQRLKFTGPVDPRDFESSSSS